MSSCLLCLRRLLTRSVHRYSGALESEVTFPLLYVKKCVPSTCLNPESLEQKVFTSILPFLKFCTG